jgi:hypothetical protein
LITAIDRGTGTGATHQSRLCVSISINCNFVTTRQGADAPGKNQVTSVALTRTACTAPAIRECVSRAGHGLGPRACRRAATLAFSGVTGVAVDAGAVCALAHTVLTQGGCPKACRVACNGRPSCIRRPRRVCHEQVKVVQALAWACASQVVVLGAPMVLLVYLYAQTCRQAAGTPRCQNSKSWVCQALNCPWPSLQGLWCWPGQRPRLCQGEPTACC